MKPLYWTRIVSPVPSVPNTTQKPLQDRNDQINQTSDGEQEAHNNSQGQEEGQKSIELRKNLTNFNVNTL